MWVVKTGKNIIDGIPKAKKPDFWLHAILSTFKGPRALDDEIFCFIENLNKLNMNLDWIIFLAFIIFNED